MAENRLMVSTELKQELRLAPRQLQSLEILQATLLELQEKITAELERNPILEQDTPGSEELVGDFIAGEEAAAEAEELSRQAKDEGYDVGELISLTSLGGREAASGGGNHVDDERRQHFFNSLTDEPSLKEQLLEQLRMLDASQRQLELAEGVIGAIDERGYLAVHPRDLALAAQSTEGEMLKAIRLVQTLDPPGIGARDLRECLLLQLERRNRRGGKLHTLVDKHLDELGKNHLPPIAKAMGLSMAELYELIGEVRKLNPYPAAALDRADPIFVIPEIIVEEMDGEFVIRGNRDGLPRIRVSPLYLELLERSDTPPETANYIKKKLDDGRNLLKSIAQRRSTIRRIAEVIVDTQYEFFKQGVELLRPLTMQQVAAKLDLHETTISRAIANKYIQTPLGLFEFKFFFTGGFQSGDGTEMSSRGVKEIIRDLVDAEDSTAPISDQDIVAELAAKGLALARRTVAKYREEMGIPSTRGRRKFVE